MILGKVGGRTQEPMVRPFPQPPAFSYTRDGVLDTGKRTQRESPDWQRLAIPFGTKETGPALLSLPLAEQRPWEMFIASGALLVSPEDSTRANMRPLVLYSASCRSRKVQLRATWGTSRTMMSSTLTRYCLGAVRDTWFVVSMEHYHPRAIRKAPEPMRTRTPCTGILLGPCSDPAGLARAPPRVWPRGAQARREQGGWSPSFTD